ncbi:hypothetical protein J3U01_07865 [Bifidobacterium sp. B4107]|uniref:hypothetical protein n=1 Tax=unclassified Bifidobacterium TaxID=2608897 RepID=UPI00226BB0C1|nr:MULTISPECIES: hypothetical protein [unclassified Bifidobacterium]MCX8648317.1 hypothetical protein [Bifidobacterium sp. B4107]MCX8652205.1 hypothetical protein [Bifidobacterium sp. B4111]MCX8658636.1 hypothetical protein [Bifidobacterium sp. B4114]
MSKEEDDRETKTLTDMNESNDQAQGEHPEPGGASLPPAIEPENDPGPAGKLRPRWLVPVIIVVVVAVLGVGLGLAVWRVSSNRSHDRALAQCSRQVRAVKGSEQRAEAASSSYLQAAAVKTDQVKDAKTVTDMAKAVGKAKHTQAQAFRCEASMPTDDLQAMAGKAKKMDDVYRSLDKASKAVLASRDAKSLDDARKALNAKKDEASKLLNDSDGKVADNAVRDSLQQAISQAGGIKGDKAKAYQDAAGALQSAIDQVNASIQQKNQADQAAQQPTQHAQAQQAAPSYSGGGYTPSYNRGGGGSAPAPAPAPAPAAPVPAAPQGGGSGGFDWNQWVQNHKPYGEACNSAGVCGIG